MVLYEPNYNYVKDTQTIGRVQRLGQTHAVSVHFLGMTDRIDQRLQKTPLQKVYESRKYNTVYTNIIDNVFPGEEYVDMSDDDGNVLRGPRTLDSLLYKHVYQRPPGGVAPCCFH